MTTAACSHRPIVDMLPIIKDAGVRGVEIGTPPRHFDPGAPEQVAAVRCALDALSLTAISIHAPFGHERELADPDPGKRRDAVAAVVAAAVALKDLGGRLVVVHPSDLERSHHQIEARLAGSAASLRSLARACSHLNMTLTLESPLPHLIGGHPDEFAWLLRQIGDEVRVCLDTGHASLGGHWHALLNAADGRLAHVHVNDNHGHRDDHLAPGDGRIDWTEIKRTLSAAGFTGWAMLELHCNDPEPGPYFERALGQTRRLLGG
jgi:sugar phosphate isomerase/epimerase